MSDETDQSVAAPTDQKSKKDIKIETMIMVVGFSLGIIAVILMLGKAMAFLFAVLLIYLFSLKSLTAREKIPAFAVTIAIALLATLMFSAGVTTGYIPDDPADGVDRVDSATTGQLN